MKTNLKAARKHAGMTQKEAAAEAGVPVSTLQKWEQGVNEPDIEMIIRFAKLYGVSTDTILGSPFADMTIAGVRQFDPRGDALSEDEASLVSSYRRCTSDRRANILQGACDAALASGEGVSSLRPAGVAQAQGAVSA